MLLVCVSDHTYFTLKTSYYKSDDYTSVGKWKGLSDLVFLGGIAFVIYFVYKCCLSSSMGGGGGVGDRQYSSTDSDHPSGGGGGPGGAGGWFNPGAGEV